MDQNEYGCNCGPDEGHNSQKKKNGFPNRCLFHVIVTHGRVLYLPRKLGGPIVENQGREFPGSPVGLLPFRAVVWVQSLVGKLRSHKPRGTV